MPKRRVYICGPMRGIKDLNFPAFDGAAQRFRQDGWEVINPADLDREAGLDNTKAEFTNDEVRDAIWRDFLAIVGTLRAENGDALAVLPGWQNSVGAAAELHLARWAKLELRDARTTYPVRIDFGPPTVTVQYPILDSGCDPELGCGIDPVGMVISAAEAVANNPRGV